MPPVTQATDPSTLPPLPVFSVFQFIESSSMKQQKPARGRSSQRCSDGYRIFLAIYNRVKNPRTIPGNRRPGRIGSRKEMARISTDRQAREKTCILRLL